MKTLEQQLMEILRGKFKTILKKEVDRLHSYIQEELDKVYNEYNPEVYIRTNKLKKSVKAEEIIDIKYSENSMSLCIYFDESGYHTSGDGFDPETFPYAGAFAGNGKVINTAYLINYGYNVRKPVWFKDYKNFGYRLGTFFIEKAVRRFNSNNPYGIRVEIIKPDNYIVR